MFRRLTFLAAFFLLLCAQPSPVPATGSEGEPAGPGPREEDLITRVRQLTFEGRRAGEGYFSPDGARMVFQSEREPGNPFYQIYLLDMTSGETRRISPGTGKTTCPFIRPVTGHVLFASTHHDPRSLEYQKAELEFRASGKERRYAWDYDPEMELYAAAPDGTLRRLTEVEGYDAEGSYSPDGKWIVFASTRQAYEGSLTDEERKQLELDPSYFAEIYVMRSDGTDLRRMTNVPGYDGGPFFMPDGKSIVWRRFDVAGLVADVWIADLDGASERQVTDFESMSWAPYPHPSGEYVFFTSNKHGFGNFELFIVDTAGRKEPVRVTYTDGFDGLPVPTPDGHRLSWTSTRRGGDKGQIMMGRWNHERALEALRQAPERGHASSEGKK